MDSLYAKYIFDREGLDSLWGPDWFVIYKINGEECFLVDMCVSESERSRGIGHSAIDSLKRVALDHDCSIITANIHLWDKQAMDTLTKSLKVGFSIVSANNDVLLISMKIKEEK